MTAIDMWNGVPETPEDSEPRNKTWVDIAVKIGAIFVLGLFAFFLGGILGVFA